MHLFTLRPNNHPEFLSMYFKAPTQFLIPHHIRCISIWNSQLCPIVRCPVVCTLIWPTIPYLEQSITMRGRGGVSEVCDRFGRLLEEAPNRKLWTRLTILKQFMSHFNSYFYKTGEASSIKISLLLKKNAMVGPEYNFAVTHIHL